MAFKTFALDDHTTVNIYKRKGSRSLRLSITADGKIRVTIPAWAPYSSGLTFAKARRGWITSQQIQQPKVILKNGQLIGKAHHLLFERDATSKKPSGRVKPGVVMVRYPAQLETTDPSVQAAAQTAGIRALRTQAENLLPQRLSDLAARHKFSYRSVSIKLLKSRWGSCDQHTDIVLNLFLMQLPWELIDYVLLHELTHTRVLHHGPKFWGAMEALDAKTPRHRKAIREHRPVLYIEA